MLDSASSFRCPSVVPAPHSGMGRLKTSKLAAPLPAPGRVAASSQPSFPIRFMCASTSAAEEVLPNVPLFLNVTDLYSHFIVEPHGARPESKKSRRGGRPGGLPPRRLTR